MKLWFGDSKSHPWPEFQFQFPHLGSLADVKTPVVSWIATIEDIFHLAEVPELALIYRTVPSEIETEWPYRDDEFWSSQFPTVAKNYLREKGVLNPRTEDDERKLCEMLVQSMFSSNAPAASNYLLRGVTSLEALGLKLKQYIATVFANRHILGKLIEASDIMFTSPPQSIADFFEEVRRVRRKPEADELAKSIVRLGLCSQNVKLKHGADGPLVCSDAVKLAVYCEADPQMFKEVAYGLALHAVDSMNGKPDKVIDLIGSDEDDELNESRLAELKFFELMNSQKTQKAVSKPLKGKNRLTPPYFNKQKQSEPKPQNANQQQQPDKESKFRMLKGSRGKKPKNDGGRKENYSGAETSSGSRESAGSKSGELSSGDALSNSEVQSETLPLQTNKRGGGTGGRGASRRGHRGRGGGGGGGAGRGGYRKDGRFGESQLVLDYASSSLGNFSSGESRSDKTQGATTSTHLTTP